MLDLGEPSAVQYRTACLRVPGPTLAGDMAATLADVSACLACGLPYWDLVPLLFYVMTATEQRAVRWPARTYGGTNARVHGLENKQRAVTLTLLRILIERGAYVPPYLCYQDGLHPQHDVIVLYEHAILAHGVPTPQRYNPCDFMYYVLDALECQRALEVTSGCAFSERPIAQRRTKLLTSRSSAHHTGFDSGLDTCIRSDIDSGMLPDTVLDFITEADVPSPFATATATATATDMDMDMQAFNDALCTLIGMHVSASATAPHAACVPEPYGSFVRDVHALRGCSLQSQTKTRGLMARRDTKFALKHGYTCMEDLLLDLKRRDDDFVLRVRLAVLMVAP